MWIWIFWWNWCSCCFLLLSVTQCFRSLGTDGAPPDSAHSNVRFIVLHRKSKIKQHCRRWSSTSATSNTVWYSQMVERESREREGEREKARENRSQNDLACLLRLILLSYSSFYFLTFFFFFFFLYFSILYFWGKGSAGSKEETLILGLSKVQTCQSKSECLEAKELFELLVCFNFTVTNACL